MRYYRLFNPLLALLLAAAVGCDGVNGLSDGSGKGRHSNKKESGGEPLGTVDDDEDEDSDPPVMVSGAFLSCGPAPARDTADDEGRGCAVVDANGEKLAGEASEPKVDAEKDDGALVDLAASTDADDIWHFTFGTPKAAKTTIVTYHAALKVDGKFYEFQFTGDGGNGPGHRIFLSSRLFKPGSKDVESFDGIATADARCAAMAQDVGLAGTWRAILSDTATAAGKRLSVTGAVYDMAGGRLAAAGRFWQAPLEGPILFEESGKRTASSHLRVWTGTDPNGKANDDNCNNWQLPAGTWDEILGGANAFNGGAGQADNPAKALWEHDDSCYFDGDLRNHLYCISEVILPP